MEDSTTEAKFPFLPKLKADHQVTTKRDTGLLGDFEKILLQDISKAIAGVEEGLYLEIDSIPNMWAWPLLFEIALLDEHHPLHERVLREWRGLLALLALRGFRNIPLETQKVSIPVIGANGKISTATLAPLKKSAKDKSKSEEEKINFLETLAQLLPQKYIWADTPWNELYAILYNNNPIALTSPTTLVCSAKDTFGRFRGVEWFDGKFFTDPLASKHLTEQEQKAVAQFVDYLVTNLDENSVIDSDKWQMLKGLLEDFKNQAYALKTGESARPEDPLLGFTQGIFRLLSGTMKSFKPPEFYPLELLPSSSRKPEKKLLVISREIAKQWNNVNPSQVYVGEYEAGKHLTLSYIPEEGLKGEVKDRIEGIKNLKGLNCLEPNDIFTEYLFCIEQPDAFKWITPANGAREIYKGSELVTPILPFTSTLLDYLTPADIAIKTYFKNTPKGIEVKLYLTLRGLENKETIIELQKEYTYDEKNIKFLKNVPMIAFWPNFASEYWHKYFTYYGAVTDSFEVEPYPTKKTGDFTSYVDNKGAIESEICEMENPPEALICKAKVIEDKTSREADAGLILVQELKPVKSLNKHFIFGVDFGTSNTHIHYKEEDSEPQKVTFTLLPSIIAGTQVLIPEIYRDFLLGEPHSTPFMSLYISKRKGILKENDTIKPLREGTILFHKLIDELSKYRENIWLSLHILSNLKWSNETEDKICTRSFNEQLALMCAAEAVYNGASKIGFKFSFPAAFSDNQEEAFMNAWKTIVHNFSKNVPLLSQELNSEIESVSSAKYFIETRKGSFGMLSVLIDIGGGTTDISIWEGGSLKCHASLLLAGRKMLLEYLRNNPNLTNKIFPKEQKPSTSSTFDYYRSIEYQLHKIENESIQNPIRDRLINISEESDFQELKRYIALGISGIIYYVSLCLNKLQSGNDISKKQLDLYFAGNGARLLDWLSHGIYDTSSPINNLFKMLLLDNNVVEQSDNIHFMISEKPKAECSYGLICDQARIDLSRKDKVREVISGENFKMDKVAHEWKKSLSVSDLKERTIEVSELINFKKFFSGFKNYTNSPNSVISPLICNEDYLIASVTSRVNDNLRSYIDQDIRKINLQPIFILALDSLLEKILAKSIDGSISHN